MQRYRRLFHSFLISSITILNTVTINEQVHPSDFLNKSLLGFHIGLSKTMYMDGLRKNDLSTTFFGQLGVDPGYNEKYLNNLYFRAGIMVGIAK